MDYLNYVNQKCIHCKKCTRACTFLSKYSIELFDFAKRSDLAYSCFLCGACFRVCPTGLDGREIAEAHRKGNTKGFKLMKLEKSPYVFRNNSKKASESLLFLGCSFPRIYPKTSKLLIDEFLKRDIDFSLDCCGKPVIESGDALLSEKHLERLAEIFKAKGVKRIITACMNCYYFFKKYTKLEVISVYKAMRDMGIGNKIKGDINLFVPCPDKDTREIMQELQYFVESINTPFDKVQCCGLGGLAMSHEPELAQEFIERLRVMNMPIHSYCASCSRRFSAYKLDFKGHILPAILGTYERENSNFLSGSLEIRNYRRKR